MALFKISKGKAANLSSKKATEGYCWFTTDDGKLYIDTNTSDKAVIGTNRICLNAAKADQFTTSRTINGVSFDGTTNINNYAICSTAAATAAKTATITNFNLVAGANVRIRFANANTAANPTLNINGTGAKPIYQYGTTAAGTSSITSGWQAGAVVSFTYDGAGWIRDYWANNTYNVNIDVPECWTASGTAAKTASCAKFTLASNHYFQLMLGNPNTIQGAITLNINNTGAKPIYINGSASSASNYTLPSGVYFVYYNGTNYYFRTDAKIQGNLAGNADSASSANKLNSLNAGSATKPVYFANGVPVECTGFDGLNNYLPLTAGADYPLTGPLGLTKNIGYGSTLPSSGFEGQIFFLDGEDESFSFFRQDLVAESALTEISFPDEIATNINKSIKLLVFQNGLLLSPAINYDVKTDNTGITLKDFSCTVGDIFTFFLIANMSQGTNTGNDYAEYRIADTTEPGVVVCENGDDTMSISKERMQPAAAIVSDTFGFAIGETNEAKTPIAVCGRVLAKPYEPIAEFRKAIGHPVCAGPNGTVSIMTDEEYATKGYCSIGVVSAVPDYEIWNNKIKINGRVWIKVR